MMPFHPWVDGELLHGRAHESEFPAIPLVIGTTAHEMELFRDQVPALPPDIAVPYLAGKAANLGILDESCVRKGFGAAGHDMVEAVADLELHVPNEQLARAHAARGNPVFRYRFTWEAPVRRACHALDLPFTFGTFDVSTWREFAGATGERAAAADAVSARMMAAWTSFAATGVPVDPVTGPWPSSAHLPLGTNDADGFHDTVAHRTAIWLGDV
jgi:para-nitrobenzyl esterase